MGGRRLAAAGTVFALAMIGLGLGAPVSALGELQLRVGDPGAQDEPRVLPDAPPAFRQVPGEVFAFDDNRLIPPHHGNTVHAAQPLVATVRVPGGLNPASVTAAVRTVDGDRVAEPPVVVSPIDSTTYALRTPPVPLAVDTRYIAEISLRDAQGDAASMQWTFRRIDFAVGATTATVDQTDGMWREDTGEWVFLPQVRVRGFEVQSSGTEHSGWGPVGQRVPLSTAEVVYQRSGTGETVVARPYSEDHAVTVYKPYGKAREEGATSVTLRGREVWLPPLALRLPADAVDPKVRMTSTPTVSVVPAEDCAVPSPAMPSCTPDPLRFFLPEDFASSLYRLPGELDVPAERSAADNPLTEPLGELPLYLAELIDPVPNGLADSVATPYWRPLVANSRGFATGAWHSPKSWADYWLWVLFENWQGWQCIENPDNCIPNYAEGAGYQSNLPVETPQAFGALCAAGYPCTAAAAQDAETEQLRRDCLQINGEEKRTPGKNCRQFNVVHYMRVGHLVQSGSPSKFDFQVVVRSQIGYMHWFTAAPNDRLGITWQDDVGWQVRRDQYDHLKLSRYDVYYCDGREQDQPIDQQVQLVVSDQVSGYDTDISLNPYGAAYQDAAQYKPSSQVNMPSQYATCYYYWPYAGAVSRVTRPAFARQTTMMISAWASTYANQFYGTSIASVGHIWRTYAFQWKPTFRPFGGMRGVLSALFAFAPYEEDKSSEIHWDTYYEYGF